MTISIAYKDIETIIDDILDRMRDTTYGLNAAITAINTQKSTVDTARSRTVITLDKFKDTTAAEALTEGQNLFFFMAEEFVNCDPFMIVSIPSWGTDSLGVQTVSVLFLIVIENVEDGTDPRRKLLRYIRALNDVFKNFPIDNDIISDVTTSIVEPDFTSTSDESRSFYSAGVKLELVYA
jgi:hypothetical protein